VYRKKGLGFPALGFSALIVLSGHSACSSSIAEDLYALVEDLKIDRFHLVGAVGGGLRRLPVLVESESNSDCHRG
jgi:hypothetical protein